MDEGELEALEKECAIRTAKELALKYQLAKFTMNGRTPMVYDFLPVHLRGPFVPPPMPEDEVFSRLERMHGSHPVA